MRSSAAASESVLAARGRNHRLVPALLVAVATVTAVAAAWLRLPQPGEVVQLIPADDPIVRINREITVEFGMQNPVVWVLAARAGTVWTREHLTRVQALTREVFTIPGVIAPDVMSIASPNVRDFRVTEEMLEPIYLMGQVPETAEAVDALRRRVEGDPNYHGTFVSLDGRAAMVVADFRAEADAQKIASAALALRDKYRDAETDVYTAGAPVLGAIVPAYAPVPGAAAAALLVSGLVVLAVTGGVRAVLAAALAVLLATVWTVGAVLALAVAVLPWSADALPPVIFAAGAFATTGTASWRRQVPVAAGFVLGFMALALLVEPPARALGSAGAIGIFAAWAAARAARALVGARLQGKAENLSDRPESPERPKPPAGAIEAVGAEEVAKRPSRSPVHGQEAPSSGPSRTAHWGTPFARWIASALVVALALPGLVWLRPSFALFGYGVRYLPAGAAADLRAIARYFPPPSTLAVRVRGEPGFIKSPEVLKAFEGVTAAALRDPAVVRALSLADLIKIVNRAFNENRPEYAVIPDEAAMVGRYLALAYSPGFRHFVDRAFTRSAIWIYLSTDNPADLARVRATVERQLAAQPVPGADVDLIGGDGAVVLLTARIVRALGIAVLVMLVVAAVVIGILCGPAVGVPALAGGLLAAGFTAGAFGWIGIPADLVSLPFVMAAAVAGSAAAALGHLPAVNLALTAMAVLALSVSAATGNLLAAVVACSLLGPALAATVASSE